MVVLDAEVQPLRVADLSTHPDNPRRGDIAKIAESIEAHGFFGALLVQRSTGHILVGNHRFLAAKRLGIETLPGQVLDVDDETARRILLVDNRASDLATYDDEALLAILEELALTEDQLAGTLFSVDDLAELVERRDGPPAQLDADDEEATPSRVALDPFDKEAVAEAAFEYYRSTGWPDLSQPRYQNMLAVNQLRATPTERLFNSMAAYAAADTYHPHRREARGGATALRSIHEAFDDDKHLRSSIDFRLTHDGRFSTRGLLSTLGVVDYGAQEANNFRPGAALSLLRRWAPPGGRVLDTSAGFGGRLLGFLASDCAHYVGIDPATRTHTGNRLLWADLALPGKSVELINEPAEDVDAERLAGSFDVALTSPPYFDLEWYCDEPTQTTARYPDAEGWRKGFLRPMLELQYRALWPGGVNMINIAEFRGRNGSPVPLPDWTVEDAEALGFVHETTERYLFAQRPGQYEAHEGDSSSPILIFRKPDG